MNAPARATSATAVLRNAAGEPPLGHGGLTFRDDQGEMFEHDNPRFRSPLAKIGVLELENGKWLAHPPGFRVDVAVFFEDREEALQSAVEEVICRAQTYMGNAEGEGTQWSAEYGAQVIHWARSLVGKTAAEEINLPSSPNSGLEVKTTVEEITDPVVAELVDAHRRRVQFPAQHMIAMTNAVINGQFRNVGTCACGAVMSHANHQCLDAAIEAHWQKFDHLPEKVDGRGNAIGEGAGKLKKPRNKTEPGTGGRTSVPIVADAPRHPRSEPAPVAPPEGAGSPISALRAIAAGEEVEGSVLLDMIRDGLVHATTTRLSLTESGEAMLQDAPVGQDEYLAGIQARANEMDRDEGDAAGAQTLSSGKRPEGGPQGSGAVNHAGTGESPVGEPAPIGAVSVADAKCETCQPAQICAGSIELATSHGGPLSDDDDLAIEWPSYDAFLEDKIVTAPLRGIEVARDSLHPWLKPHCKDLTVWALRLGCAAIFANFGLHKTAMQLEWCRQLHKNVGGATLNVVPLGVRHGFIKEALQLGMEVRFIRTNAEFEALKAEGVVHFLTNYESIREGKLDPNLFQACSLDEASVLRSYGSKTFQEFLPLFSKVEFKLVATATPSPNRYKELIHYAGFLGVMDTGLALTRWFQRNSEKAGDLTLYPHKEDEFWMWVHSWAAFLQRPSELGYSDEGYELPPLRINWHEVPADHSKAAPERDGQGVMFRNVATGLQDAARSRRDSLSARVAKMIEIVALDPEPHRIIWHDLEAEREAIEQALPEVVTITGSMDIDDREIRLHDFEEGRIKYFGTKPILSGSGSNFQYHCHKAIYVGMPGDGYKFNDFIQSIYRLQRFGQQFPVEVDIIYSEDMRAGRAALEQKWALDTEMRERMRSIILAHGLNTLPLRDALARTIGVRRVEIRGQNFIAINNDCVTECRTWPDNSVDQIITSIPFSNHYEYSASYRDFGHTDDNGHFWGQMDFLTCELLRILKPGRLACIHVKDRVLFGSVTGEGVSTISPFHAEAIMHYRAHGFQYMGMIHIDTDVVKENADGSYRLGWSENCKDSTTKGVGSPEYVLLMRKRQSDRTRGYADVPVVKAKWNGEGLPADETPNGGYSRARWQIDAHAFWRSSGNRLLTVDEFAGLPADTLRKIFAKVSSERIYDYEAHVQIGERLERAMQLPAQWSCLAPGATTENTWYDVIRMHTLNSKQVQQGREKHICPLQFDIVDRLINRFSNEGDLILDPFGGIGTVPYRAMLKKRRGALIELSATYFLDGVDHCRAAESKMEVPQLFDLVEFDAANAPPPRT